MVVALHVVGVVVLLVDGDDIGPARLAHIVVGALQSCNATMSTVSAVLMTSLVGCGQGPLIPSRRRTRSLTLPTMIAVARDHDNLSGEFEADDVAEDLEQGRDLVMAGS